MLDAPNALLAAQFERAKTHDPLPERGSAPDGAERVNARLHACVLNEKNPRMARLACRLPSASRCG
jgi:hypothetical protein